MMEGLYAFYGRVRLAVARISLVYLHLHPRYARYNALRDADKSGNGERTGVNAPTMVRLMQGRTFRPEREMENVMRMQRIFLTALFVQASLLGAATAQAQAAYPNRPIRLIVPFPPGGGAEATARVVVQRVSEGLGQPIVIESRAGAGGNIGSEAVARATPDGYTLLFTTSGVTVAPHLQKLAWDPLKDLAPVSLVVTYPLVIAAHPSTPATTLRELIAYAKANPGKLSYGSSGTGG